MSALGDVRALRALTMRRRGCKLVEIAIEFGVTKERARQLVKRGHEVEHRMASTDPFFELSTRARNVIVDNGCEPTPHGVFQFTQTADIPRVPNLGRLTIAEINKWLTKHWRQAI